MIFIIRSSMVKNIVEKGENAGSCHLFFLSLQYFQKPSSGLLTLWIVWCRFKKKIPMGTNKTKTALLFLFNLKRNYSAVFVLLVPIRIFFFFLNLHHTILTIPLFHIVHKLQISILRCNITNKIFSFSYFLFFLKQMF